MQAESFEFAVSSRIWRNKPLDFSCFREAHDNGFNAIEIFKTAAHFSGFKHEVKSVKKAIKSCNVQIDSLHSDLWILSPPDIRSFRRVRSVILQNLDLLSELGGRFLVIHLCVFADPGTMAADEDGRFLPGLSLFKDLEKPESGAVEKVKEGLAFYSEEAKKRGVVIALETDIQKNGILPELLSYADPLGCGICFDSGHSEVDYNAVEILKLLKKHVVCTHLHDNDGRNDLHLPPFQGIIDWINLFKELSSVEYKGKYTFECGEKLEELVPARNKMKRLLANFR